MYQTTLRSHKEGSGTADWAAQFSLRPSCRAALSRSRRCRPATGLNGFGVVSQRTHFETREGMCSNEVRNFFSLAFEQARSSILQPNFVRVHGLTIVMIPKTSETLKETT